MSSLRVLWISDSPVLNTGYAKIGRELLPRLAREVGAVAVAGWFHPSGPDVMEGVRIYTADTDFSGKAITPILDAFQPDVVIGLGDIWMFDWWTTLAATRSIPIIGYALVDGRLEPGHLRPYLEMMDRVVSASQFTADLIRQAGGDATPVIPFGVDCSVFRPADDRSAVRRTLQAVDGAEVDLTERFIVGCVARNQPRKQFPLLVSAFSAFAGDKPEALLYLHTATRDAGWDLGVLARQYGVADRMVISETTALSGIPEAALAEVYQLFDVFALPTMGEGFGLPFLEAMACGVPIITTDCAAGAELVGPRGDLIRVKERLSVGRCNVEQVIADEDHFVELLNRIYARPRLRSRYASAGRRFAQSMTWDRCVSALAEVLEQMPRRDRSPVGVVSVGVAPAVAPLEPAPKLSIIIPVHGQRQLTENCLQQLRTEAPEAELLVVDNGSPDDTLAWLRTERNVTTIALPENRGVPAAWNLGVRAASGDLLCLLNNDVDLRPGGIAALAQAAQETGIASWMGGQLDEQLQFCGHTDQAEASDYPDGCALAFRRDVYEAVGPFDTGMGLGYYEDADWGIRARAAGYDWRILPDILKHLGSRTAAGLPGRDELLRKNVERLRRRWRRVGDGRFAPTADFAVTAEGAAYALRATAQRNGSEPAEAASHEAASHVERRRYRSLVAPLGTRDCSAPWQGRVRKKPWQHRISAAIPHLETIEPLRAVVELLRLQTEQPYVMIVDTGSSDRTRAALEAMRAEDLEIHYISGHGYLHTSEPVAVAQDLAFALCRTEYLFCTHADCFLRRPDYLAWLLERCGPHQPAVGYQMSPRDWLTDEWEGMVSHTATLLHMPTMHRLGVTWGFERAHRQFEIDRAQPCWPDTETCMNLVLRAAGVKAMLIGNEENFRRHVDENIDHVRSYPGAGVYAPEYRQQAEAWMDDALRDAWERVSAWQDRETKVSP